MSIKFILKCSYSHGVPTWDGTGSIEFHAKNDTIRVKELRSGSMTAALEVAVFCAAN